MKFANPEILFVLFIIPVYFVWEMRAFFRHETRFGLFSDEKFLKQWIPARPVWRKVLKAGVLSTAIALCIFALARPQGKPVEKQINQKLSAVYFVLDCSASMRASDVQPNRFIAAKKIISGMVNRLNGKQVGLIVFTEKANVLCPATNDHISLLIMLEQIQINHLAQPGSNPAAGVHLALEKLSKMQNGNKAVVLVSDGEDNQKRNWTDESKRAHDLGIPVHCVGVGTLKGGAIPIGKDFWGKVQYRQFQGEIVKTRLQTLEMRKIVKISGGVFVQWNGDRAVVQPIVGAIFKHRAAQSDKEKKWVYQEYFSWAVILALVLLLFEPSIFLTARRYNV